MEGSGSYLMQLYSGGPVCTVSTKMQKYADSEEEGVLYVKRCITYSLEKRFLSLNITEKSKDDHVNSVHIDVAEKSGTGSSADMTLHFVTNKRYGVLCTTNTKLSGSYELVKQNFCVPPFPETELTCYVCPKTGNGSLFTLEKMKDVNNSGVVKRVKGTHAFMVGDRTLSVEVKIKNDTKVGLRVEVEPPLTLTMDYSLRAVGKIQEKMERGMTNVTKATQHPPKVPRNGDDNPNGKAMGLKNKNGDRYSQTELMCASPGKEEWR